MQVAAGFAQFFLHDNCTAQYPPQPDTCLHDQLHEQSFTFGGKPGTVYDVTLRIRGIFEPTTITGGDTPDPAHPYFKVGGTASTADWSHWGIEFSEPKQTYWLNHYPWSGTPSTRKISRQPLPWQREQLLSSGSPTGTIGIFTTVRSRRIGSRSSQESWTIPSRARCCVSTWYASKQNRRREELFNRERHSEAAPGRHSCRLARSSNTFLVARVG